MFEHANGGGYDGLCSDAFDTRGVEAQGEKIPR
jgi:hypothetical protein